jgi:hypothetical protein
MAKPKARKPAKHTISPRSRAPRKAAKARAVKKQAPRRSAPIEPRTKTEACVALLVRPEGASLEELQRLTGWQAHSVRGFLAGTVKKIPGASLTSEKPPDGTRRYYLRRATT